MPISLDLNSVFPQKFKISAHVFVGFFRLCDFTLNTKRFHTWRMTTGEETIYLDAKFVEQNLF